MSVINQYQITYPSEKNNFESDIFQINATSMEKAVEMAKLQYGKEPVICTKIHDNVLTEITSPTTVNFQIKSYYIENEQEIEIPNCVAYPTNIENAIRGSTVYLSSPDYQFYEDDVLIMYTFDKWIYNNETLSDNVFIIPLDESITEITLKAIYEKH